MKTMLATIIAIAITASVGAVSVPLELGVIAETDRLEINSLRYIEATPPNEDDPETEEDESSDGSPAMLIVECSYELRSGRAVIERDGLSIMPVATPEFRIRVTLTEEQFATLYGDGAQAVVDALVVVGETVPTGEVLRKMREAVIEAVAMLGGEQ